MKTWNTYSSEETRKLGEKLASSILKSKTDKRSKIVSLEGDLGAGKTTFVQGFLRGAGYKGRITSPTFILWKRFKIKNPRYKNIFHVDAYRIKNPRDLDVLGFKELLLQPENIFIIEWAGNIKSVLGKSTRVKFLHGKKETERKIKL